MGNSSGGSEPTPVPSAPESGASPLTHPPAVSGSHETSIVHSATEPKITTGGKLKRFFIAVVFVAVVVGALGTTKYLQIRKMIEQGSQFTPPPETVTTTVANEETWDSLLTAVGSLEAVQGVMVSAELSGKVVQITFESGATVKAGDLLVQQDVSSEDAQLRAAEATMALAKIDRDRTASLLEAKSISQAEYDNADSKYKQAQALADTFRAVIAKKTIRAPFSGCLGVRLVNLGQILKEGEPIVTLQTLDPILVNFALPQRQLADVRTGLKVRITTDALTEKDLEGLEGELTAISPEADPDTRNVRMQATVSNPSGKLRPGMFVEVAVVLPTPQKVISIPATAVLYAPYGNSVFVVEEKKDEKGEASGLVVRQQLVRLGESRGDFVAVDSGLNPGETVVSTGVFKLRNGQSVVVDNTLSPEFSLAPKPAED